MASNIYKAKDTYYQFYQVCVESEFSKFNNVMFVINEYWVCWAIDQKNKALAT
jgi:hypothetical protein